MKKKRNKDLLLLSELHKLTACIMLHSTLQEECTVQAEAEAL